MDTSAAEKILHSLAAVVNFYFTSMFKQETEMKCKEQF